MDFRGFKKSKVMVLDDGACPWFPIIFSDKCDGCAKTGKPRCVEFCPNGVFTFQDEKAVVAYPAICGGNCSTVRCSACAPLCHKRAIFFPQRNTSINQVKEEDKSMIRKTICPKCGKKYWTNRENSVCFDCENQS